MRPSLTVIMPAYNEAENLEGAYKTAVEALSIAGIADYEFFIMTVTGRNGKHDGTPEVAAGIAKGDARVRHFPTPFFAGLGFKYREGVYAAAKEYVMLIPAHNLTEECSLVNILLHVGKTDAIFAYTDNPEARPSEARFVSKSYVGLCNVLFGLDMKYYNGISVIRRNLLLKVPMSSDDHSCMAEIVVYLVKSGVQYLELPQLLKQSERTGRAWSAENAFKVFGTLCSLFWRINLDEERIEIPGAVVPARENFYSLNETLQDLSGTPDLFAVFQHFRRGLTQIIHPMLIYLVKFGLKYLGFSRQVNGENGWKWDPEKLREIAKMLFSLLGRIATRMAVVKVNDAAQNKFRRRKRSKKRSGGASLTVIMPAHNDAPKLADAYRKARMAIQKAGVEDYEILITTSTSIDGSDDGTIGIADDIAGNDNHVRHLRKGTYEGLGFRYRQGVGEAKKDFIMLIPGDGEFEEDSTAELISHIGKAEIVIPYIANPYVRSPERQFISQGFTTMCNKLFGLNLKYFNGPCIIPRRYVQAIPMSCDGFAYMAEVLVYLIKSGVQYVEVPWKIEQPVDSKAFHMESAEHALETAISLFWKINVEGTRICLPD